MFKYNYLLFFEYDGRNYCGWQKQPNLKTVQGEIEKAARKVLGRSVKLIGASRTDSGVHALVQAANLLCNKEMAPERLCNALNASISRDVAVFKGKRIRVDFSARYRAKRKIYAYKIWNNPIRSVFAHGKSWHIREPLNINLMLRAAKYLTGKHNFSAFAASGGSQTDKNIDLQDVRIFKKDGYLTLTFKADRFLYHMVRNLVGTLVDVGRGKVRPGYVKKILVSRNRNMAGRTAPAYGLYLKKVIF